MTGFILATKLKQTSGYDEQKARRTYTVFTVNPCYVTQVKTESTDGYQALQIGTLHKSPKNINKVTKGPVTKAGINTPLSFFTEIRVLKTWQAQEIKENDKLGLKINDQSFFPGTAIVPEQMFALKDKVKASATTKGKGFAGVVKRHGFAGGPKTHGQSDRWRAPGSIGSGTTPGRVWKGKKMAGRMGGEWQTIKGLKIAKIEPQTIMVQGLVPGPIGSIVTLIKQS